MKIIVDADACPREVLATCLTTGRDYGIQVWTVASFNHKIISDNHIVVGDAPQEADMRLLNMTERGDVAVTQDWGLAAMLLGKGAFCLSPDGREYKDESIEFLLEKREAMAKFRRSGGRTKGPRKRTREDDESFISALVRIIQKARDKAKN